MLRFDVEPVTKVNHLNNLDPLGKINRLLRLSPNFCARLSHEFIRTMLLDPAFFGGLMRTHVGQQAWADLKPGDGDNDLFMLALAYLNPTWTENFDLPRQYRNEVLFRFYLTRNPFIPNSVEKQSKFLRQVSEIEMRDVLSLLDRNSRLIERKLQRLPSLDSINKRDILIARFSCLLIIVGLPLTFLTILGINNNIRQSEVPLTLACLGVFISLCGFILCGDGRKYLTGAQKRTNLEKQLENVLELTAAQLQHNENINPQPLPAATIGRGSGLFDIRTGVPDEEQGIARASAGPAYASEEDKLLAKDVGAGVYSQKSGYGSIRLGSGRLGSG